MRDGLRRHRDRPGAPDPDAGTANRALRPSRTHGPRGAIFNPYTGVVAISATRLSDGQPPGEQRRDAVGGRNAGLRPA
jgi:hypothetical protein